MSTRKNNPVSAPEPKKEDPKALKVARLPDEDLADALARTSLRPPRCKLH